MKWHAFEPHISLAKGIRLSMRCGNSLTDRGKSRCSVMLAFVEKVVEISYNTSTSFNIKSPPI